jgi:hypothetical protein
LPTECGKKCASNAQQSGDEKALWRIRPRHEQTRDNPGNKANYNNPKQNSHGDHPLIKPAAAKSAAETLNGA